MIGMGLEKQRRNFIAGKAFHREVRQEKPRRSQRKASLCVLGGFFARSAVKGF
jgi:hypothetical protein